MPERGLRGGSRQGACKEQNLKRKETVLVQLHLLTLKRPSTTRTHKQNESGNLPAQARSHKILSVQIRLSLPTANSASSIGTRMCALSARRAAESGHPPWRVALRTSGTAAPMGPRARALISLPHSPCCSSTK